MYLHSWYFGLYLAIIKQQVSHISKQHGLISETLIIHFVRTSKVPFVQSRANPILTALTMVTIIGTIVTPIILHNVTAFNFEILPPLYYLIVLVLVMAYAILVQVVKKWYIKKYGDWL